MTDPFPEVKTCVSCAHLQQGVRAMSDRLEYTCGRTGGNAYAERLGGGCGYEATAWEEKR